MKVDRALQKRILERLYEEHPHELRYDEISLIKPGEQIEVLANMAYLQGHGLVDIIPPANPMYLRDRSSKLYYSSARITSQGIDFLEDDGGLSAILGVVTVKLHDETIQALLSSKVEASNLAPEDKQTLIKQIRELRGEAAKTLVNKLIDYGLSKGPNAMQWLSEAFKSLQ